MYYEKYFPFHTVYGDPAFYEGEKAQEQEFALMKSYYPDTVRRIQEQVEEECELLDYEGSRIYDEYPDKYMLYHLSCRIRDKMRPEVFAQGLAEGALDELVQVLLYNEISRRRCRRRRCRKYFPGGGLLSPR